MVKNEELHQRIEHLLIMLDKTIENVKIKVEKLCENNSCF